MCSYRSPISGPERATTVKELLGSDTSHVCPGGMWPEHFLECRYTLKIVFCNEQDKRKKCKQWEMWAVCLGVGNIQPGPINRAYMPAGHF